MAIFYDKTINIDIYNKTKYYATQKKNRRKGQ
jgi:hypothetical protein